VSAAPHLFRRAGELQKCAYCARQLHVTTAMNDQRATRDHVHPRHLGGTKCVWACVACNSVKGGMTLEAWQAFMQVNPRWWMQFKAKQKVRKRAGPKKKSPPTEKKSPPTERKSAKRKSAEPKPAQPPRPVAQAASPDASAGPGKRGRPKLWIRRKAPLAASPKPSESPAAPAAPKPAKRRRPILWNRRKPLVTAPQPQPVASEAKSAPLPAKRKRIWIRRKARA
jgi:hypothetical protein